jgi:hypothetical protein
MKQRNPFAVFFFSIITLGIYGLVWHVKTKNEMNKLGAKIPTAWLLIIPFVNYYWYWKYSEGVEQVTNKELSTPLAFVLLILLGVIGSAVIQLEFNKVGDHPVAAADPAYPPVAPTTPDVTGTTPTSFTSVAPIEPVAPTPPPAPSFAAPEPAQAPVAPTPETPTPPAPATDVPPSATPPQPPAPTNLVQ